MLNGRVGRSITAMVLMLVAQPVEGQAPQVVEASISSEYQPFRLVRVASGLSHPWAVAFLTDGRMLVTERPGGLRLIQNGRISTVSGLPDDLLAQNQGGLLDVVPHPDHASNGWIYMTYSRRGDGGTTTALFRARLEGSRLTSHEHLFEANRYSSPGRHYGSRIVFLGDGTLLMSIGDRGADPPRAQDPLDHAGSLVRLNDNGTPATNNPFATDSRYAPEIYSYGHRNVQGIIRHPITGEIWVTEHGPRGSDELNRIVAGSNYGWPTVSLGRDYRTQEQWGEARRDPRFTAPAFEFLPTLAPSGLAVVHGGGWHETWQGNLLAGGLRAERVLRLVIENNEVVHAEELLLGKVGRVRDVRQGPDGFIYVLSDQENGALYRIEPLERNG
jgi:aldose sugar dehydrogenase